MTETSPRVIRAGDGGAAFLGGIGVRFLIDGNESGERFALVQHPMPPRALGSPLHRHHDEDEYSFVLEGSVGALLGESAVIGNIGDLIVKPRHEWHTFWNAGDTPARILEVISPAGFENFFRWLAAEIASGSPDPQRIAALSARYKVEMDLGSVPGLVERFGVRFPGGLPHHPPSA